MLCFWISYDGYKFSTARLLNVLRIAVAVACGMAIWSSLTLARADYLFKKDTEASVRAAIRLVPDSWSYYMRLSEFDRAHAHDLLTTSLRLNPYNAQADIELGLQYEADGDFVRAEKQLLEAYDVDHTYMPRWSLANYYFRRDNMPEFWIWARSAAAMPANELGPSLSFAGAFRPIQQDYGGNPERQAGDDPPVH